VIHADLDHLDTKEPMAELRNIDVSEALSLGAGGALLLDVREDDEWASGRAPDALHVRLADLPDHVGDLPRDRPIVCICRSGGRSARAASFLIEQGFDAVNLDGGMQAWERAGAALLADQGEPTII
jgi:rhodanese-related sulfurtransferase